MRLIPVENYDSFWLRQMVIGLMVVVVVVDGEGGHGYRRYMSVSNKITAPSPPSRDVIADVR